MRREVGRGGRREKGGHSLRGRVGKSAQARQQITDISPSAVCRWQGVTVDQTHEKLMYEILQLMYEILQVLKIFVRSQHPRIIYIIM